MTAPWWHRPSTTRSIPVLLRPADRHPPATWPASRRTSTTCRGSASTPCGSRRSTPPQADFGYDVSDHCDVDPDYGDLAAFDEPWPRATPATSPLVDLVPNHTSDRHPWFQAARSSRDDPKRDWYVWRDGSPDTPPNNWRGVHPPARLDLGRRHRAVVPAPVPAGAARPQLGQPRGGRGHARGHAVLARPRRRRVPHRRGPRARQGRRLPDDPPDTTLPHATLNDTAENHEIIRGLRSVVDEYPGDRLLLGEVYLMDTRKVATYYGHRDELHLAFNFPPLYTPWDSRRWRDQLADVERWIESRGAPPGSCPTTTTPATAPGTAPRPAQPRCPPPAGLRGLAGALRGRGAGPGGRLRPAGAGRRPRGRDGCRAPIPWTGEPDHGWG